MKFKIGDEVTCIDNSGLPEELTLGKNYIVTGFSAVTGVSLVNLFNDEDIEASFYGSRFILASDIESSATPTEHVVGISQNEYDEMYDRIELLESLLVDANKRIAELEAPVRFSDKPIEDYTMEDWQKAMNEKWVFQLNSGAKVYVNGIMYEFKDEVHPVELSNSGDDEHACTVTLQGHMFAGRTNHPCSVNCRIK